MWNQLFWNTDILKISQVCIKLRVSYFLFLWKFPGPWDHQQTLLALPSFHWASPFPACRTRTQFQLSPGLSVPVQNILLLCLFAAISLPLSPFATDGIPGIECGPGSGAADGPSYQPMALPAALSPCGTGRSWGRHGLCCITLDSHALREQLALAAPWHQVLINGFLFSFYFFLNRSTFSVQLCSTV